MLRIFALLLAWPTIALSQTGHEHHSRRSQPAASAQPSVAAPTRATTVQATSVTGFERYQRFTPDEPLKGWRQVNDTVRDIGGWQVYGLEAARAIEAEKKAKGGQP